jgi:lysozyme
MSKWAWCLIDDTDKLVTGWCQVGDYWYYFYSNGSMATGWLPLEKYYYLNESGQMKTGWVQDDGKWYYLIEESNSDKAEYKGQMVANCTREINGKNYTFDEHGAMIESKSLVTIELIDFVKTFEGFSATPYFDEVGVKTLGYGLTGEEIEGISEVTEEEATNLLKDWVERKYAPVIKEDLDSRGITLKQNEFDALVSFAYNCGTGALFGSTLYKNVCAGVRNLDIITSNFQAWSKAGGQRLEGLYRRRTQEANIFLNADYTGNI